MSKGHIMTRQALYLMFAFLFFAGAGFSINGCSGCLNESGAQHRTYAGETKKKTGQKPEKEKKKEKELLKALEKEASIEEKMADEKEDRRLETRLDRD